MGIDGQQVLSVMNYRTGQAYTWSIESGGGSLSVTTGEEVTYTAPDSNPDGENNPTIKLSVENGGEVVCDTLSISVNAYTGAEVAYAIVGSELTKDCTPGSPQTYCEEFIWFHNYDCSNNLLWDSFCGGCSCNYWGEICNEFYAHIEGISECSLAVSSQHCIDAGYPPGSTVDKRTATMKTQGCCPAALLPGYEPKPLCSEKS